MPDYIYEGRDKNGKLVKNQVFAPTRNKLIEDLRSAGIIVLSVKEAFGVAEKRKGKHKRVKAGDLVLFAKELAVLMENGITVIEALEVVLKQITSEKLAIGILTIKKDLENGASLHDSMAKLPQIFGKLWIYLIEAGEVSGQLPFVLRHIQSFLESREEIRKKTINAMIYPVMLLIVATGALIIFSFKIIPMFRGIYASLGGDKDLPAITQGVLNISEFIKNEFLFILSGVVLIVFVIRQILATGSGRRAYEQAIFSAPVIGGLCTSLVLEKFSTTLQILLKSGVSIIRALELAANTAGNSFFAEKMTEARAKVMAGLPLADAMHQTGLFPPIAVQFIIVAEKTGKYPAMFEEISRYYKDIIDTAITRIMTLMEPVMLVVMGLAIGTIVVAMFMPIFKLANLG